MEFPKRLVGWVRDGAIPYEVRLRHEPDLFCPNRYRIYQVAKVTALPVEIMYDAEKCPEVKDVYYRNIHYWDGYTLRRGDDVMVEPVGEVFRVYNERGGVRLRLKKLPDNIR